MSLELTSAERAWLDGQHGEAGRLAMRILVTMGKVYGAERLLEICSAHIDGCLYHGPSGLDFAERLVAGGARVVVESTLNVGALDLLHSEHFRGAPADGERARRLMVAYEEMGCRPTWTCAPYLYEQRPPQGSQIAWAESNAIVFANSVLGARTNRYGDFIDICAAITGRAPACGLHLEENRRGQDVYQLVDLPAKLLQSPMLGPVLGYHVGRHSQSRIPVIEGLPLDTSEDVLKALGAAAASAGAVAMFHAVGITPEASTLEQALQHQPAERTLTVGVEDLRQTLAALSTVPDGSIEALALGSPHFSLDEFARLTPLIRQHPPCPSVEVYVCTSRLVLALIEEKGWAAELRQAGVRLVVDTCVVVTPIVRAQQGTLMTDSGKFAHYTPGNLGLGVIFGSLEECVRSAAAGQVWRDPELWR